MNAASLPRSQATAFATSSGRPSRPLACRATASFVQESVPERIAVKHQLYKDIEDRLAKDALGFHEIPSGVRQSAEGYA
jgi:3-hydroxyacyl-CoA dehydrogenase